MSKRACLNGHLEFCHVLLGYCFILFGFSDLFFRGNAAMQAAALASSLGFALVGGVITGVYT